MIDVDIYKYKYKNMDGNRLNASSILKKKLIYYKLIEFKIDK